MLHHLRRPWILFALATATAGCDTCGAPPPEPPPEEPEVPEEPDAPEEPDREAANPLLIDVEETDFSRNPDLLHRLRQNPHAYFRFIHREFSTAVCREFGDAMADAPPVNLHGDAHLEQYAVTDLGRGLTDFDGATTGPGLLDLARMGVSIHLTAAMHDWEDQEGVLFDRLLSGYHDGLFAAEDAPLPPDPAVVRRIRESFEANPRHLTDYVDEMTHPVSEAQERALREGLVPYVQLQHEEDPSLPDGFFEVVSIGRIDLGIGSALNQKYLFRVQGPTDAPGDDVVLEAKEVLSLAGIPCIQASPEPDPFRILVGQARIAYRPFPHLGFIRAMDTLFWMHGWTNHYHELKVDESYQSPEELAELLYDVGIQLGRGHVNSIASPLDLQLRRSQASFIEQHGDQLRAATERLATRTTETWEEFMTLTEHHPALEARHEHRGDPDPEPPEAGR